MKRASLALVLLLAGCRQVAGIDDRAASGPACAAVALPAGECPSCLASSCCDEMTRCGDDSSCESALACLARCTDTNCREQCRTAHENGFGAALAQVLACQASACTPACDLSCGGYVYPDDACGSCAESHCCNQEATCGTDSECLAMSFCARACDADPGCVAACQADHLAGASDADALGQCLVGSCAKACGDPRWACLGHVQWAAPSGQEISFGVQVTDFDTQVPLDFVQVRYCDAADYACNAPLFSGHTLGGGHVTVNIATQKAGYFEMSLSGYPTTLNYWRPPLTDSIAGGGVFLSIPSASTIATWFPVALDPNQGIALIDVHGCSGGYASGISVSVQGQSPTLFYQSHGLYSPSASETDASGLAAAVGLEPTPTTFVARVNEIDQPMDTFTAVVRAGGVTEVPLMPSPSP